jgi:hypothetical protein
MKANILQKISFAAMLTIPIYAAAAPFVVQPVGATSIGSYSYDTREDLAWNVSALTTNAIAAIAGAGTTGKSLVPAFSASFGTGGMRLHWLASADGFGLVARINLAAGGWEVGTNVSFTNGMWKEVLIPATSPAQSLLRLKSGN